MINLKRKKYLTINKFKNQKIEDFKQKKNDKNYFQ